MIPDSALFRKLLHWTTSQCLFRKNKRITERTLCCIVLAFNWRFQTISKNYVIFWVKFNGYKKFESKKGSKNHLRSSERSFEIDWLRNFWMNPQGPRNCLELLRNIWRSLEIPKTGVESIFPLFCNHLLRLRPLSVTSKLLSEKLHKQIRGGAEKQTV